MKRLPPLPALAAAFAATALVYFLSPLSFDPVPWPDDSAFFLTGADWIRWPPSYRMHSQAAFVPSYDVANFNTMPGLPLLFGVLNQLGLRGSHAIRLPGMLAFAAWAFLVVVWALRRGLRPGTATLLGACALLSPSGRWGAMVVRPEIWQGLLWTAMLMEIDGKAGRPSRWRLPALLAAAAYVHFEAIIWVPGVAAALALRARAPRPAARELWAVTWRVLVLLSPWLIYALAHWTLFWEQMDAQFHRLAEAHPYLTSPHSFFHSLFLHLGNPAGYPKFFNLGKGITWGALVVSLVLCVRRREPAQIAAALGLAGAFYLWVTKPETWFTAMIHYSLWPLVAVAGGPAARWRVVSALGALALLAVLGGGTAVDQWRKLGRVYDWPTYRAWVDCIDSEIGERRTVWQPHVPDALVELRSRRPERTDRDYTRASDFEALRARAEAHALQVDAIVHTLYLPVANLGLEETPEEARGNHRGTARERDLDLLANYPWLPFRDLTALRLPDRSLRVCHQGPFWAALTLAREPSVSTEPVGESR